jgi:hypothetical protein
LESEFTDGTARFRAAVKRLGSFPVLAVLLVLSFWLLISLNKKPRNQPVPETKATDATATEITTPTRTGSSNFFLGENILRGYADTNFPPENDLTLMSRLMENSLLLLKSAANRPLSANEDWADLFRGRNAAQEKFLPDQHVAFNARGQLIDRWGAPLFFHALGSGRYELRSAGPDKKLWTDDDLHRNADGSFRRGSDLNSPSLLESAPSARRPATAP